MIPRSSIRIKWVLLLSVALLFGGRFRLSAHEPRPGARARKAIRRQMSLPIPDFSLTDQRGKPLSFRKFRGKVVLVTFIYTSCPDLCPLITSNLRHLQRELREGERRSVSLLSITTDPEIDHPRVLESYGKRYGVDFSNWSFLTGEPGELLPVWSSFGVKVQRKARGLINHTSLTALVDGRGVMRFAYYGTAPDPHALLRDLRLLLNSH